MVCYNPPIAPHHYVQFEPPVLLNGSNTFGAWLDLGGSWFMVVAFPLWPRGPSTSTPTLPLCPGVFLPCHWVPAVWHLAKLPSDNASRGPERLLSTTASPPGMLARTAAFRERWWRFCPPPSHVEAPLRSAQTRPWSSPVARVSPGDLRDFPWSLQHRLADAISQGSAKAGEPKCREEHSPSPRNLAMSCRSEATKTYAMDCRKKPRDALSVRSY